MLEGAHSKLLSEGYVAIGRDHFALKNDPLAIAARVAAAHGGGLEVQREPAGFAVALRGRSLVEGATPPG
ncbi:MAG: hypothetical protein EBX64_09895 [Betaproteobacteria bacterium]|nr:hypothetical protein [Betaproteobacteria bacterium]